MGVDLWPPTLSILLANAPLDSLLSYSMAIMASLLLEEVDGCMMLALLLTVSLSLCRHYPSTIDSFTRLSNKNSCPGRSCNSSPSLW